jgi:hypothetical protein
MTFLQPFMLFGLAAAAIPLVLHLLTLRRLRTIEFSTLEFLKELQRSRIRRLRIQQWLLLLLRTALVILLVLAFGRPTLEGTLPDAWGAAARSSAVIVMDDSPSMTVVDEQGERLRRARDAAAGIIRSFRDGDDVAVIPFSSRVPTGPSTVHALTLEAATSLRASSVRQPLESALQMAASILSQARSANKELYIVSDLQRTLLERSTLNPLPMLQDPSIHVFVVPVGEGTAENISLAGVRFGNTLVDLGRPFSVELTMAHRGTTAARGITASLFFGSDRVDQRAHDLAPGSTVDASLAGVPRTEGWITGRVLIEGDDAEFDNARSFVIRIRKEWRILLIGADDDLRYLRLALQVRADSTGAGMQIDAVAPDRLSENRLLGYDAFIVTAGDPALDRWAGRLRAHVERGTGLVLIPSVRAAAWGAIGESFGLGNAPPEAAGSGSFMAFQSTDLDHPIFQGMFDAPDRTARGQRRMPTPEIQRSLSMRIPPRGIAVVTLSNGQPFLVEMPVGQGRAVAMSTAADERWSNLPTQGLFVPLLHRSLAVAAGAQEIRPVVVAGGSVDLPTPPGMSGAAEVMTPDRRTYTVAPASTPVGTVLRIGPLDVTGEYTVRMEGRDVDRFAVVIDDRETDTTPSTEEEREAFLTSVGLDERQWTVVEPSADMAVAVREARIGTELWRFFLLAALLVAVAESIVAVRGTPHDQRGGS